jgi:hypothetical protein
VTVPSRLTLRISLLLGLPTQKVPVASSATRL